ncbi:sugar-binding domain-containing protein [Arcanobacterium hippocoleae]|uniref:sugar-binding domain-containing protein n=1 Tax=Arcanobacterium hippocoleae TaxID=149017 RepID=UPI0033413988
MRQMQADADIAVFGVGALDGKIPSQVYAGGYLSPDELAQVCREGVVGDVCTVLLRADGSWEDLEINARASGPSPQLLRQIERRVCVVSGLKKRVHCLRHCGRAW